MEWKSQYIKALSSPQFQIIFSCFTQNLPFLTIISILSSSEHRFPSRNLIWPSPEKSRCASTGGAPLGHGFGYPFPLPVPGMKTEPLEPPKAFSPGLIQRPFTLANPVGILSCSRPRDLSSLSVNVIWATCNDLGAFPLPSHVFDL